MRRTIAPVAMLAAMTAGANAAQDVTVLYAADPWVVVRYDNPTGSSCLAVVGRPDNGFSFIATKAVSAISVSMSGRNFPEHSGSLMLIVDDSGMGTQNAIYSGNSARIAGLREFIYVILSGLNVPGFGKLDVLDDKNKVMATFNIAGIGSALKAWKDCADAL
jgi:hypothetical protein